MQKRQEIIESEVNKFFNNEYIKIFEEIKLIKGYRINEGDELNNYDASEIACEISKKDFCIFVNEISEILNNENIKTILKYFEYEKKKRVLDFIIIFTFLMYEIIEDINMIERLGINTTYFILKYLQYYDKEGEGNYKDLKKFYFEKKIMKFSIFYLKLIKRDIFPEIFYDSFFIKDEIKIIVKDFLQSNEICGICLNEYNTDMISYCEIHYICLECYKEADVGKCINKCETKKLIMYKKT